MDIDLYVPRKMVFKAWNLKTKLLMRLNSIDCERGVLIKNDHILLQCTGKEDEKGEELYEMDVVLIDSYKFVIVWKEDPSGWYITSSSDSKNLRPLSSALAKTSTRLCSFFESERT